MIKNYNPSPYLTVDEQLLPFKGRCPFWVYIKNKPHKFGIKFWMLSDAETKYVMNIQIYTGKEIQREVGQGQREVGQGKMIYRHK